MAAGQQQHPRLFGREVERVAVLPQRLDPFEQRGVHRHVGAIGGELGRDLALQRFAGRVGVGAREVEEHAEHLVERRLGKLQRLDGVLEARRRGVVGDGVDIGPRFRQRRVDGGAEVFVGDVAERRQGKGAGPVFGEGIGHGDLLCEAS